MADVKDLYIKKKLIFLHIYYNTTRTCYWNLLVVQTVTWQNGLYLISWFSLSCFLGVKGPDFPLSIDSRDIGCNLLACIFYILRICLFSLFLIENRVTFYFSATLSPQSESTEELSLYKCSVQGKLKCSFYFFIANGYSAFSVGCRGFFWFSVSLIIGIVCYLH